MQKNTRVHNTDQKEENAMNNNLSHGSSHKEKPITPLAAARSGPLRKSNFLPV
jgi:hypothetical protein